MSQSKSDKFNGLPPKEQALVAIGVMLDGYDAGIFLANDMVHDSQLREAAEDLASDMPDERLHSRKLRSFEETAFL